MKVNTDFKSYITLAALVVGLTFTVLAVSTNHWYDNKISSDGLARLGVKTGGQSISFHEYTGLWEVCASIEIPTISDFSRCFKVTEWKTASTLFSDNPLVHLNEETDDSGYKAPVPDNSFPQSFPNSDGSNNPFGDANTWESPENAFGSDNKRRKRRNSGNPWDDFDDRFGNLPTKLPEIPKIQPGGETFDSEDDASMDGQRQAIYPDYLKGVQAMEVLALISGVAAIGVWIAYLFTSAMTRKGVASTAVKVIAIVLVVLTAVFHAFGVIVWLAEKEKEKSGLLGAMHVPGMESYFGWSYGMAIGSMIIHILTIIPLALTKRNQLDDGMEHSLTPRTV